MIVKPIVLLTWLTFSASAKYLIAPVSILYPPKLNVFSV